MLRRLRSKGHGKILGIGDKLSLMAVGAATLCLLLLIGFQVVQERALLRKILVDRDTWATQALASQLSEALRTRHPSTIAAVLGGLVDAPDSNMEAMIAFDHQQEKLFRYDSPRYTGHEHLSASYATGLFTRLASQPGPLAVEDGKHLTVLTPVQFRPDNLLVGFLAVQWNLEHIEASLIDQFLPLTAVTGLMMLALVTTLIHWNHRIVGRPLALLAGAVRDLSRGRKTVDIPEAERTDEIGDMARAAKQFQQAVAMIDRLTAEQQEHTARLAQALEKEREYNALQKEFVSMASHEFRTPLAIIDGTAQRVARRRDKVDADEIGRRMDTIRQEVQRLTELVDSTLSSGRMDAGKLDFIPTQCDLAEILSAVCARQKTISRGHEIHLDLEQAPATIWADPTHLDNIFTNLVSNATKYSPTDPLIEIQVTHDDAAATVSIRDYGIGIPAEEVARLFQKYFRASTAQGLAGTGIGLHLVKHLVELHRGRVEVESEVGAGSVFRVILPIEAAVDEAQREETPQSISADLPDSARQAV